MAYSDHFRLTDDLITHLDPVLATLRDPFIESRYAGFLSVSAVTVYELAIKDIFLGFSHGKHKVLGNFATVYFDRINGRIKIQSIKDDYIKKFGEKYVKRFEKKLDILEHKYLRSRGVSLKSSYTNIITWRNSFAHEGKLLTNATYNDVKNAYQLGKDVIRCLADSMKY